MNLFITVEQLQQITKHKHQFIFYDNHDDTFDSIRNKKDCIPIRPNGTVWECECGAREIRFIVWTGRYDTRKKEQS